jgi:methanogenic corrinoid protein MtbC1
MREDGSPRLPPVEPDAADVPAGSLSPELLASLLVEGDDELAAWTLRHALAERSRAEVFDDLLASAMALVGQRWETGQWGIAEEHLASQTILRALDRIRPDLGPEGRIGPLAVLTGVAGEHHMIGLACLGQVLQELGWTVATLGADVPAADLAQYVARNEAVLVALSATESGRLEALVDTIATVRAARPDLPILLGGRLASRPGIAETLGIDWAGTSLVAAARVAGEIAAEVQPGG